MKYFIDWARSKKIRYVDVSGKSYSCSPSGLPFKRGDDVFIETGFSKKIIHSLIDRGVIVHTVLGKTLHDFRGDAKKTDLGDAFLLRELYQRDNSSFVEVPAPDPKIFRLKELMSRYRRLTVDIARLRNSSKAIEWEYGSGVYMELIKQLQHTRNVIIKEVSVLLKGEFEKIKQTGINGIGGMSLAGLLSEAHPQDFTSLSRYLAYCGCKASSFYDLTKQARWRIGTGRFSRKAKYNIRQIAINVLRKKDKKFYDLYLKVREDLENTGVDSHIHSKALNRLQTFLLKEIYYCFSANTDSVHEDAKQE